MRAQTERYRLLLRGLPLEAHEPPSTAVPPETLHVDPPCVSRQHQRAPATDPAEMRIDSRQQQQQQQQQYRELVTSLQQMSNEGVDVWLDGLLAREPTSVETRAASAVLEERVAHFRRRLHVADTPDTEEVCDDCATRLDRETPHVRLVGYQYDVYPPCVPELSVSLSFLMTNTMAFWGAKGGGILSSRECLFSDHNPVHVLK
jgi:hypothetical protein